MNCWNIQKKAGALGVLSQRARTDCCSSSQTKEDFFHASVNCSVNSVAKILRYRYSAA